MLKFVNSLTKPDAAPGQALHWDPQANPFYLEVGGETQPQLSADNSVSAAPKTYEYTWTLAHPGTRPGTGQHGLFHAHRDDAGENQPWHHLADAPAARVYVYFPISRGWRIQEVTATVKYLSPTRVHTTWLEELSSALKVINPLAAGAESVAKLVPGGSTLANWLDVVAKLQVQSVPQSAEFPWSVQKVSMPGNIDQAPGLMDGVLFDLPKVMFDLLGGRITGSIAVTFNQTEDDVQQGDVLVRASIVTKQGRDDPQTAWLPTGSGDRVEFLSLPITPHAP